MANKLKVLNFLEALLYYGHANPLHIFIVKLTSIASDLVNVMTTVTEKVASLITMTYTITTKTGWIVAVTAAAIETQRHTRAYNKRKTLMNHLRALLYTSVWSWCWSSY